jgi:hypothetical protein
MTIGDGALVLRRPALRELTVDRLLVRNGQEMAAFRLSLSPR